jgi:hypothetical protein
VLFGMTMGQTLSVGLVVLAGLMFFWPRPPVVRDRAADTF